MAFHFCSRKLALRNKYQLLIKSLKSIKMTEWLARYKRIYFDISKLNMPEITNENSFWDFINVAEKIDLSWAINMR